MQHSGKPTTQAMRARMDAFIAAASEYTGSSDADAIDELSAKFLETLSAREIGFLMHDNPQPLSLQEVDSDIKKKYRIKYGTKNLKRGQFFKLKSGTITFFTHEHNLKFKMKNLNQSK
jgi:hypothetical protein